MSFAWLGSLEPTVFIVLCALLGLLVGSFLNVVIHRLPKIMENDWRRQCAELSDLPDMSATGSTSGALNTEQRAENSEKLSLIRPRSRCPGCGHAIRALENIPLLSWLVLGGKCSACRRPISLRYPLIEVVSAVLSAFAAFHFGASLATAGALLLIWILLALTCIDFDTQLLPDALTLPLLWLGLCFNLLATYTDLASAVLGAIAGYLVLWTVYWVFKLATGKEGMGYGDFKLLAAIGAWVGWQLLPLTILLSSLVGALVGIMLLVLAKRGRNVPIPFGPYLAAAGLLAFFWGKELTEAYLRFL